MIRSSSDTTGLKDSCTMVLHNWEFWKPVSSAMVRHLKQTSLWESTVQPMENMTIASIMVSTVLNTKLSIALKSLAGTRQLEPEQTVAKESQVGGTMVVAFSVDIVDDVMEEEQT
ncbi:hypothetical protein INR49_000761 [Caranx melampygus]|nr:hypothetical protein INR49_000761 [Caranx melampygus]